MIFLLVGLCLFSFGILYRVLPFSRLDSIAVNWTQDKLAHSSLLSWFEELWFFGRTPFTITVLLLLTAINWKLGLSALVVFGTLAGIERLIKVSFNRPRPFTVEKDLKMLQPKQPDDPSFPSGDVFRGWYLALILSAVVGNNVFFVVISVILAGLVSLGRMVLGVHYLTDVLAGAGLGFLGTGVTILLWQFLNII